MDKGLNRRAFVGTVMGGAAGAAGLVGVVGAGVSGLMYTRLTRADEPAHSDVPGGAVAEGSSETYYQWTPVDDGDLSTAKKKTGAVAFGDGGNTLLVHTEHSAVLIDTKNSPFGEVLRSDVGVLGPGKDDRPWATYADRLVVNTHHHADHTGGNFAFTPMGAVLAHAKALPRVRGNMEQYRAAAANALSADSLGKIKGDEHKEKIAREHLEPIAASMMAWKDRDFLPTRTFNPQSGGVEKTKIGDIELELHHFGPGHTDNDLIVRLPEWNVLHVGDYVFRRLHPFIDRAGGATVTGWIRGLEGALGLCNAKTIVIPGHGEVTDADGIREEIEYLREVWGMVTGWVDKGMSRDDVTKQTIDAYKSYGFEQFRPITLGGMYDEAAELAAKESLQKHLSR